MQQWIDALGPLGYIPDPITVQRQVFGMIKIFDRSQSHSVSIYMGSSYLVWKEDAPALWEQITMRLGTDQWSDYIIYFDYHPEAERATLNLLEWVAQHHTDYVVVTQYHHLFLPSDLAALDRAMLYWGNDPWDDDD